ncbi:DNA cytosine methyltransferase [Variovorax sp.]|jgi:DNA (cytosine-5)-methyltransferase 1|uniref:DNA cytosine methyltransferase n=1 Tax=Variovorax sp. TaxID=1871043 RepID=UPI000C511293|nr:DNA cytosine methyltransferase [Variovorax sp.]MBS77331.1 DNA (cytosine-5-)-methyltransferase [Variovorax sp.]
MKLTFIDLFAGCGGLSLGLMQAGHQGVLAVEKAAHAYATLDANLVARSVDGRSFSWPQSIPRQAHDIASLLKDHREAIASLNGKVDLVVGGPPCQGFSVYGKRKPNDFRNTLYRRYLDFVKIVNPRAVILENVEGINMPFADKRSNSPRRTVNTAALRIQNQLKSLGYGSIALRLCASRYGAPQIRPRFFIVAIKNADKRSLEIAVDDEFLEKIRSQHLQAIGLDLNTIVSTKDAISDLEINDRERISCPDSKGFEQAAYQGPKTAYQHAMRGGMENITPPNSIRLPKHAPTTIDKFRLIQKKGNPGHKISSELRAELGTAKFRIHWLGANRPAPTITTLPDDFVHYSEPRILTVRECARLQTFPDWFDFHGKYTTGGELRKTDCPRYTQVGNAVPPRLARFLGTYIQELLAIDIAFKDESLRTSSNSSKVAIFEQRADCTMRTTALTDQSGNVQDGPVDQARVLVVDQCMA